MDRISQVTRMIAGIVIMIAVSAPLYADTIRLKDGSLIKGTIVSFAEGRFIVAIGEGSRRRELTLDAAEIASIQFDPRDGQSDAVAGRQQPADKGSIVPVSTRPAPKLVVTDDPPADKTADDGPVSETQKPKSPPPATSPSASAAGVQPVTLNVKVLADNTANGWTNSGWIVKKGQRIRISATGTVSLGRGRTTPAAGLADVEDEQKLLKSVPTGALLAVIGDDNNDFIYIGSEREFTAGRDGALYLGVNEGDLNDNSGSFQARVEILPGPGN